MSSVTFVGGPLDGQTRAVDGIPGPLRVLDRIEPGCPMPEHVYALYVPVRDGAGWAMLASGMPS